jgi:hypothetical protein
VTGDEIADAGEEAVAMALGSAFGVEFGNNEYGTTL